MSEPITTAKQAFCECWNAWMKYGGNLSAAILNEIEARCTDPPSAAEVRRAAIAECVAIAKAWSEPGYMLDQMQELLEVDPPKSYLDGLREALVNIGVNGTCTRRAIEFLIDAETARQAGGKLMDGHVSDWCRNEVEEGRRCDCGYASWCERVAKAAKRVCDMEALATEIPRGSEEYKIAVRHFAMCMKMLHAAINERKVDEEKDGTKE